MSSVKVAVRVRPFNKREIKKNTKCIVSIKDNSISIEKQLPNNQIYQKAFDDVILKTFYYDNCFWSFDKESEDYASQKTIYDKIGRELLDHAFTGYNTCIFAYGQTGAGKSYTMMGLNDDKGIIPLACEDMFKRIKENKDENLIYLVEVSYIEIYCERVRDLLNPSNKENLRVREHPILGPYVEDLSKLLVTSIEEIMNVMDEGNKSRTVASTKMNEVSSRSHAVFTIKLTQKHLNKETNVTTQKESRISFVDLAGSERINSTKNTGVRLKEGVNINKSLTTLGKVISSLAEQSARNATGSRPLSPPLKSIPSSKSSTPGSRPMSPASRSTSPTPSVKSPKLKLKRSIQEFHIPYRDSVLTWLLKDSLGGNSKTVIIAAISPADVNYEESLSTLRFAERAKHVVNTAVINESNNMKLVDELKKEVETLKKKLESMKQIEALNQDSKNVSELQDLLSANEKLVTELNMSWEEKLKETETIHKQRENALADLGITLDKKNDILGLRSPQKIPHLVNLNEDPLMSECLLYQIRPGITRVGNYQKSGSNAEILLTGTNVKDNHCYFENKNGTVTLYPNIENNAITLVNGRRIFQPKVLKSGYRVIIGECHVFRFINPEEARKERKLLEKYASSINSNSNANMNDAEDTISDFSTLSSCDKDWYYAQREKLNRESLYSNPFGSTENIIESQMNDETNSTTSSNVSYKQTRSEYKFDKRNSHFNSVLSNIINNYNISKDSGSPIISSSLKSKRSVGSLNRFSDNLSTKSFDPLTGMQDTIYNKRCSEDFSRLSTPPFSLLKNETTRNRRSHSLSYSSGRQKPFSLLKQGFHKQNISISNFEFKDLKTSYQSFNGDISPIPKRSLLFKNYKMDDRNEHNFINHNHSPQDLMEKYFSYWKTRRFVKLSEEISSNQDNLRNANVISKELNMNVIYQFMVTNDVYPLPKSFWEISLEQDISMNEIKISDDYKDTDKIKEDNEKYIHSFTKNSEHYAKEYPYRLIVKVIDGKNNKIYYWTVDEFNSRLNQMKLVYDSNVLNNKIVYDPYDNMIDPFRENSKSSFMLIGYSKCILSNLLYSKYDINYTYRLPIISWQTGKRQGYLTVKFLSIYDQVEDEFVTTENDSSNDKSFENSSSSSNVNDRNSKDNKSNETENEELEEDDSSKSEENFLSKDKIKIGTELYFDIIIEKIEGISEDNFTQVHCQFDKKDFNRKLFINKKKKLSKPISPEKEKMMSTIYSPDESDPQEISNNTDTLFSTNIKNGFKDQDIIFNYSQTIHLRVTKNIIRNLKHGYLKFEVFGSKPEGVISSLIDDLYSKENDPMNEFRAREEQILDTPKIDDQVKPKDNDNNDINEKTDHECNKDNETNDHYSSKDNSHSNSDTSIIDFSSSNDNDDENVEEIKELNENEIYTIPEDDSINTVTARPNIQDDYTSTITDTITDIVTDLSESKYQTSSLKKDNHDNDNKINSTDDNNNNNSGNIDDNENNNKNIGTFKKLKNKFSTFSVSLSFGNKSKSSTNKNSNTGSNHDENTNKIENSDTNENMNRNETINKNENATSNENSIHNETSNKTSNENEAAEKIEKIEELNKNETNDTNKSKNASYDNGSDLPTISRRSTIIRKASRKLKRLSSMSCSSNNISEKTKEPSIITLDTVDTYRHNIIVGFKICELSSDGTYKPVNVQYLSSDDLGAFLIHQGLQRRIEIEVMHTSGDSLPIRFIKSFTIGSVRKTNIKSKKSYLASSDNDHSKTITLIPLVDQTKEIYKNGKQSIHSKYSWDSSLHESILLNKETEKDSKILVKVEFEIGFEGQQTPSGISVQSIDHRKDCDCGETTNPYKNLRIKNSCKISMDIALIIQNRQESQNIFSSLFSKLNMVTDQYSESFNLILNKDETGQKNCLLCLPKEEKYIRGEEGLGKLKFPNAEDLIVLSINMMKKRRNAQMAEYTRQYLNLNDYIDNKNKNKNKNNNSLTTDDNTSNGNEHENSVEDNSFSDPNNNSITTLSSRKTLRNSDKLLNSVLYLWKSNSIFKNRIIKKFFYLDKKDESEKVEKDSFLYYTSEFSKIKYSNAIQKKGHLYHPDFDINPKDETWIKSYVVIQRPYLIIYKHKNRIELVDVINLQDAKVTYDTEATKNLNKENVFEVYTQYHSIFLQASNKKDMVQWINTIDPLGVGAAMSNVHQQK